MSHKIDPDKCLGCGSCSDTCPAEAISAGKTYVIDPDKCVDCGACAAMCPNEAIASLGYDPDRPSAAHYDAQSPALMSMFDGESRQMDREYEEIVKKPLVEIEKVCATCKYWKGRFKDFNPYGAFSRMGDWQEVGKHKCTMWAACTQKDNSRVGFCESCKEYECFLGRVGQLVIKDVPARKLDEKAAERYTPPTPKPNFIGMASNKSHSMSKVAIVGVEGSGKTVMLAGLGELYSQPNENGYFLAPKDFETTSYVNRQITELKSGKWPMATVEDLMQGLDWTLRRRVENGRPQKVGELSFLDFAGEVYRAAFVRHTNPKDELATEVERLKQYLAEADSVLVLVNLSDVIKHGQFSQRVEESVWITNAILDFVLPEEVPSGKKLPSAAIVLSQSDSYKDTIEACGGPKGILQKYLPHVANNYGWLDTFAVCTVDKTILDDDGNQVPAPDFTTKGLAPIMDWILSR